MVNGPSGVVRASPVSVGRPGRRRQGHGWTQTGCLFAAADFPCRAGRFYNDLLRGWPAWAVLAGRPPDLSQETETRTPVASGAMSLEANGELVPVGGGDSIPLLRETLTIGRRDSCDIPLRFPNVSGIHCQLNFHDGY